jgi:hypothetical protein
MTKPKSKKPEKRPVFQARFDPERMDRLRKVADHKGVSMSGAFRILVDAAYARLPEEKR